MLDVDGTLKVLPLVTPSFTSAIREVSAARLDEARPLNIF